jgi:hypothetical protein
MGLGLAAPPNSGERETAQALPAASHEHPRIPAHQYANSPGPGTC